MQKSLRSFVAGALDDVDDAHLVSLPARPVRANKWRKLLRLSAFSCWLHAETTPTPSPSFTQVSRY